jgi:uncharacterized protein (DUF1810 family)
VLSDPHNLQRFIDAQDGVHAIALAELRAGRKESHWMWFVFPQLAGLGRSPASRLYAVGSLDEARAYLAHPILGPRLRESVEAVRTWAGTRSAEEIFGPVDAMKLRSSLTLFDEAQPGAIFRKALENLFGGQRDPRTLALLPGPD